MRELAIAIARGSISLLMKTQILREVCSLPTAPFVERYVVEYVREFVAARKKLRLSNDPHGNLLIELPGQKRSPRWIFTAHMDHPGFVAKRMIDKRTLEADFLGYVLGDYFKGEKVRFFDGERDIAAVVQSHVLGKDRPVPSKALLRVDGAVPAGAPGMWDQGMGRTKAGKFISRVCDDLAGAAGALQMLDMLHQRPPVATVGVLLTRAEEEGFIGAIAASLAPSILRKSDRLIAIECSAMQPFAPQGNGAIIRIGDRTSVFNSSLSYFISQQAAALTKRDRRFKHQRALMPGGTCEATVYDVYGFTAASICVALGNYHNMDSAKKQIGPEFIEVTDWKNMVKLFVQIAKNGHRYEPGHAALRKRLEKRFSKWKRRLET
jgi:putative aminopeptidase FrvX